MLTVWTMALDTPPECVAALARLLAPDETARAARFRQERDRNRFIVARARLRQALASHLGEAPAALRFTYGPHGKPLLDGAPVHFNLSHADDRALLAISDQGPVGVDLEGNQPAFPIEPLYSWVCTDHEVSVLTALAPDRRRERFFRYWTRKEAFCKTRGDGLSLDVRQLDAALDDEAGDDWFALRSEQLPTDDIRLRRLELFDGYAATVAAGFAPGRLEIRPIADSGAIVAGGP